MASVIAESLISATAAVAIVADITTTSRDENGNESERVVTSLSGSVVDKSEKECLRENSLLYLLLMLGTVWLSLSLYNFTKTYKLNRLCVIIDG